MEGILSGLITLVLLVVLQAVLGFDNLLYISLESKKAPEAEQGRIRLIGISISIILRIVLLLALYHLISQLQDPFLHLDIAGYFSTTMNLHSVIVLIGGAFIIYTATKEIWHMMSLEEHADVNTKRPSSKSIIFWIVVMNVVFSIDSILSAMALTDNLWIMMTAIVISGVLMIWLSDKVSTFLQKNRMYEVLGLFVLLVVGIMLVTEGGHLAHITIFENPIVPMSKTTFYFVLGILVLVDIVQGKYQKKLSEKKALSNGGK